MQFVDNCFFAFLKFESLISQKTLLPKYKHAQTQILQSILHKSFTISFIDQGTIGTNDW